MNKDQGGGIIERFIYGAIFFIAMKFVQKGYIDSDMAAYIASGVVTAFGGAYAWWHNRPASVLTRAGNVVPENAQLVIQTKPGATPSEKADARVLAESASSKVVAKT